MAEWGQFAKKQTYFVLRKVLDAPSVAARQLHDLPLQASLRGIARHGLAPCADGGFVIGTDPRGQALVGHLTGNIGIQRSQELIMQVFLVAIVRCYYGVDSL